MGIAWTLVLVGAVWATLALWLDGPGPRWSAVLLCLCWLIGCAYALVRVRPRSRALLLMTAGVTLIILYWFLIPARNDRDWTPDVARLPRATINGNRLTIENVRNFNYTSEENYMESWETRTYDFDKLRGMNMFIAFWGPTLIAHTIASWEFVDGPPLAISIETRKEKGETYSALRGFFRQFELYYVVADERDVIGLRTNHRGERVYLYRIRMNSEGARAVLLDYLKEVNRLVDQPVWYNALTHNCTTSIRHHALHVGEGNAWDWRILVNGHIDQLGYQRGMVDTTLPFAELKSRSEITEKAKSAGSAADFSTQIREGLPGMGAN